MHVANLLKTITLPATVLTGYWTLVYQDTTLLHDIWIALLDVGLSRFTIF